MTTTQQPLIFSCTSINLPTVVGVIWGWEFDPEKDKVFVSEMGPYVQMKVDYHTGIQHYYTPRTKGVEYKNLIEAVANHTKDLGILVSKEFTARMAYWTRISTEKGLPEEELFMTYVVFGLLANYKITGSVDDLFRQAANFRDLLEEHGEASVSISKPWAEIAIRGEIYHKSQQFERLPVKDRREMIPQVFTSMFGNVDNWDCTHMPNYAKFEMAGKTYELYAKPSPEQFLALVMQKLNECRIKTYEVGITGKTITIVFEDKTIHLEIGWIKEITR